MLIRSNAPPYTYQMVTATLLLEASAIYSIQSSYASFIGHLDELLTAVEVAVEVSMVATTKYAGSA